MGKLFKPFAALVTKWRRDEFFTARVKLTAVYVGTAAVMLGIFSYLLYGTLFKELNDSLNGDFPTDAIQQAALNHAAGALEARIIFADIVVLALVLIFGFFVTSITLRPIKKATNRERRFIADAAHELRTPLAVMKTEMEVTLRGQPEISSPVKKTVQSAIEEINGLTALANNLLEMIKGGGAKVNAARFSVTESSLGVVKKLLPLARAKHIALAVNENADNEIFVMGDAISFERALSNIIHNAIQYTPNGGSVAVTLLKEHAVGKVIVKDSGIGIPPEQLSRVFDPFFRVDESHSEREGAGLGLSITREIIEKCGGAIALESEVGKGTIVTITLPLMDET
ncbi:HAMP domain-containing histidine kinase [Patescibacteria group bacterium]|nr:HAMP domain-containing histidine kinase [Patescibacteria group bacterium]MCL5114628.1 HAMP domain-containing histidine kinase [Patescibacteria group bacterium]